MTPARSRAVWGLAAIVAPGVTGFVVMGLGWTVALLLGAVLDLLAAVVMFFSALGSRTAQG